MKWRNVPIPEAHVIGIVGVIFLHLVFPLKIFAVRWRGHILGWFFIIRGICLAGWSVIEADAINIDSPGRLITSGPAVARWGLLASTSRLIYFVEPSDEIRCRFTVAATIQAALLANTKLGSL